MKRVTFGLIMVLALFAISSFASDIGGRSSASMQSEKTSPVQASEQGTVQVAIVTEKGNPVKESVGQVPNANVFNVWKPIQELAGYRTVERPPNIQAQSF